MPGELEEADSSQAQTLAFAVRRPLLWALAAEFAVLTGTGIWLFFWYLPNASPSAGASPTVSAVHEVTAWATLATAFALAMVVLALPNPKERRIATVSGVVVGVLVLGGALLAGYRLPWDSLALWAVAVGRDVAGLQVLWHYNLRGVSVRGHLVAPSTVQWWTIAHLALAAAVAAGTALLWRFTHKTR